MSRKRTKAAKRADAAPALQPDPPPPEPWGAVNRFDGYGNYLSGLGHASMDRVRYGQVFDLNQITNADAGERWRGTDLGKRVVEIYPEAMIKSGWTLSIQPGADDDTDDVAATIEAFEGQLDSLRANDAILQVLYYLWAYGGGLILINADDGMPPDQPLDEGSLDRIVSLVPFSGGRDGEATAHSYVSDPMSPDYGAVEIFRIQNTGVPLVPVPVPGAASFALPRPAASTVYAHSSRCLVFSNTVISREHRVKQQGWGDSVFVGVDGALSEFFQGWSGVANLLSQLNVDVLKVSGLSVAMAGGDKASRGNPITNRARALQMSKSISRMLLIDSEEDFQRAGASLSGLSELLGQYMTRVAGAADIPVDILFSSLNAGALNKGDSVVRLWYDKVRQKQERWLRPQLTKLIRLLMLAKSGPTAGVESAKWCVRLNPLYQPSDLEQAQLRKTVAETDHIYIGDGVLTKEEVASSAYGGSGWSMERAIDVESRQALVQPEGVATSTAPEGQPLELTPSAQGAIITVNEARAKSGLPPLTTATGELDPQGNLTIAQFTAANATEIATAAQVQSGETTTAPEPTPPPPQQANGVQAEEI